MDEKDIAALDPGIRDVVCLLNEAGIVTTDSGDGLSKADGIASGDALAVPHVACRTTLALMVFDADRILALLGPAWHVEASYCANDRSVLVLATGAERATASAE